jgi:hypothetical protein
MINTFSPEHAYVSSAVGGSLSQVSLGDNTRNRVVATNVGSTRGKIEGFSEKSRRTLLRCMASINRAAFRAYEGRVIAATLTYPHEWPEDPEPCKRQLEALHKRLKRKYREVLCLLEAGDTEEGSLALSPATLRPSFFWISR